MRSSSIELLTVDSKVVRLAAFHSFVVGGPVLSLAVEHDIKIIFRKAREKQWVFSMADPRLQHYLVEHELDGQLMLIVT